MSDKHAIIKTIRKVYLILDHAERKKAATVISLMVVWGGLDAVGIASVMPFLAVLGNPDLIETNFFLSKLFEYSKVLGVNNKGDFLVILGISAFILILAAAIYRVFAHYSVTNFVEMMRHSIAARLFEMYLRQPYIYFVSRNSGDMTSVILSEVDQVVSNVIRPLFGMIAGIFIMLILLVMLITIKPWLALSSALLLGGGYIILYKRLKNELILIGNVRAESNKSRFLCANEAFGGIKNIKLLGLESFYAERYVGPSTLFAKSIAKQNFIDHIPKFIIEAVAFGGILLTILLMMLGSGGIDNNSLGEILPVIGLFTFSIYRLQPALQAVFQGVSSLRHGHASVKKIYNDSILFVSEENKRMREEVAIPVRNKFTLKNICYSYPHSGRNVLYNINLEIKIGTKVGIVGSTGAGKTTIADILLGLLSPTHGAIYADETEVTNENIRSWQLALGYVPQEIYLSDANISENIAFGIDREEIDHAQVIDCARKAQVHDFITQDLPDQYETYVGERGVRLSGGQRQRIGIARALYHNPQILIFDEATSALDGTTELAVMSAIETLSETKTIVIIAHRLGTIKNCDAVVLLDNGRVNAVGTYDELMGSHSQFKKMALSAQR